MSFTEMAKGIAASARRYPDCSIANCDCHSRGKRREFARGCRCLCHLLQLKRMTGRDVTFEELWAYMEMSGRERRAWLLDAAEREGA